MLTPDQIGALYALEDLARRRFAGDDLAMKGGEVAFKLLRELSLGGAFGELLRVYRASVPTPAPWAGSPYTIGCQPTTGEEYIDCASCGVRSYHYRDVEERFCQKCALFLRPSPTTLER